MTNLEKEIIENGIHYTLHGDYYFPDLIPYMETTTSPIWNSLIFPFRPLGTMAGFA